MEIRPYLQYIRTTSSTVSSLNPPPGGVDRAGFHRVHFTASFAHILPQRRPLWQSTVG